MRAVRHVIVAVVVLLCARPGFATPDLNGRWQVQLPDFLTSACFDFHQSGTAVSAGFCSSAVEFFGTIDLGTGQFTVSKPVTCGSQGIGATLAPDNLSFTGTAGGDSPFCNPHPPFCSCISVFSAAFGTRDPCGNGVLDAGEQCDDGNNAFGDCCSPTCQLDGPATACGSDLDPCTADVCDGAGTCTHDVTPGAVCRAASNACDPPELCTAGGSCPADVPVLPDGSACDDADTCTAGETCTAGVCGGGTRVCLAPFKCYRVKDLKAPKFAETTVALADQFGSATTPLKKPALLCNPATLDGIEPMDAADHLACYKIAKPAPIAGLSVEVGNVLGSPTELAIVKPAFLCVSSQKTVLP